MLPVVPGSPAILLKRWVEQAIFFCKMSVGAPQRPGLQELQGPGGMRERRGWPGGPHENPYGVPS